MKEKRHIKTLEHIKHIPTKNLGFTSIYILAVLLLILSISTIYFYISNKNNLLGFKLAQANPPSTRVTLSGKVINNNLQPVANVPIMIGFTNGQTAFGNEATTTLKTGSDGKFTATFDTKGMQYQVKAIGITVTTATYRPSNFNKIKSYCGKINMTAYGDCNQTISNPIESFDFIANHTPPIAEIISVAGGNTVSKGTKVRFTVTARTNIQNGNPTGVGIKRITAYYNPAYNAGYPLCEDSNAGPGIREKFKVIQIKEYSGLNATETSTFEWDTTNADTLGTYKLNPIAGFENKYYVVVNVESVRQGYSGTVLCTGSPAQNRCTPNVGIADCGNGSWTVFTVNPN